MSQRLNSMLGTQLVSLDDADSGEGLSVFFSQGGEATTRWRFVIKAKTDQGVFDVGEFYSSPPAATAIPGKLSRMIGGAVCPGAIGWDVEASCIKSAADEEITPETAEIVLISSKCCTAPIGASRVAERYAYVADASPSAIDTFRVLAGMRVTGIAAIGLTGGGTVTIAGGPTITIPDGISANLEPAASIAPNSLIALTNVDWAIEYLESA